MPTYVEELDITLPFTLKTEAQVDRFLEAVEEIYYLQESLDELPKWQTDNRARLKKARSAAIRKLKRKHEIEDKDVALLMHHQMLRDERDSAAQEEFNRTHEVVEDWRGNKSWKLKRDHSDFTFRKKTNSAAKEIEPADVGFTEKDEKALLYAARDKRLKKAKRAKFFRGLYLKLLSIYFPAKYEETLEAQAEATVEKSEAAEAMAEMVSRRG